MKTLRPAWVLAAGALLSLPAAPARADHFITTFSADGLSASYNDGEGSDELDLDLRTGNLRDPFDAPTPDGDAPSPDDESSVSAVASQTSPDGKTRIDFAAARSTDPGRWSADGTAWTRSGPKTNYTLTRGGKVVSQGTLPVGGIFIAPYWTPDSKRIVLVVTTKPEMMRDPGAAELVVLSTAGPRLQLVAAKDLFTTTGPKVAAALDKAGFVPTSLGLAHDPHPTSTVYAAKGFEALAAKVAAAVPGGASVAPLNWKADADVLVAVGNSAVGNSAK